MEARWEGVSYEYWRETSNNRPRAETNMPFIIMNQVDSTQLAMDMKGLYYRTKFLGVCGISLQGWRKKKEEELRLFSASFPRPILNPIGLYFFFFFLQFLHLGKGRTHEGSKEKKEGRIFKSCPQLLSPCSASQRVLRDFCVHCLLPGRW